MTKKNTKDIIKKALDKFTCPYCQKKLFTTSGRSLHHKACKAIEQAKKDTALCVVGDEVWLGNRLHHVAHIDDSGLVVLDNDCVVPSSQINTVRAHYAKILKDKRDSYSAELNSSSITYEAPKTVNEWFKSIIERWVARGNNKTYVMKYAPLFFKHSPYTKHKGWHTEENLKNLRNLTIATFDKLNPPKIAVGSKPTDVSKHLKTAKAKKPKK